MASRDKIGLVMPTERAPAASIIGFVGDSQQLAVLRYDYSGAATGVVWSSSDPSVATVDASGLVTFVASGIATITATVDGRAYTTTATAAVPLSPTLDWAPVANPSERSNPLVQVASGTTNGNSNSLPYCIDDGDFDSLALVEFMRASPDDWGAIGVNGSGNSYGDPTLTFGTVINGASQTANATTGPIQDSAAILVSLPSNTALVGHRYFHTESSGVDPDFNGLKTIGMHAALKAVVLGDVGKQVRCSIWQAGSGGNFPDTVRRKSVLVTLTADWQYVGLNVPLRAQLNGGDGNGEAWFTIDQSQNGNTATQCHVGLGYADCLDAEGTAHLGARNDPWSDQFGLPCQMRHINYWLSGDSPSVAGGTTSVDSGVPAPDSGQFEGGRTMQRAVMPVGGQLVGSLAQCRQTPGTPGTPTKAIWLHVWIKPDGSNAMPADGALQAGLSVGGSIIYSEPMVRDAAPYRAADGACFYRGRMPVNLENEDYEAFQPFITNISATQYQFLYYRCAETPELDRNEGWHHAWVPKIAQSRYGVSNIIFPVVGDITTLLTRAEGFWIGRYVLPFAAGTVYSGGHVGGIGLWQSGPYGSANLTFDASILGDGSGVPSNVPIIEVQISDPDTSLKRWTVQVPLANDATVLPAGVPIDLAFAWKNGVVVACGIGYTPGGTDLHWLTNGESFLGGAAASVPSAFTGTVDWELSDHLGYADRDKTRMCGGFLQGNVAGKTVPSAASIQDSMATAIAKRFGPR